MNDKKIKACFVILHYLALRDTAECISSIISTLDSSLFEIVVVDNASNNDSVEQLEEYFKENGNVHFLKMNYNSGFAKGNNYGYEYAKKNLQTDFIILINNDTLINQKTFLQKVSEIYQKTNFDILGPDIISLANNAHQNPIALHGMSEKELDKTIRKTRILIIKNAIGYLSLRSKIAKFLKQILEISKNNVPLNKLANYKQENPLLHGSCLIFSSNYIKKYNGIFSGTFMFGEEDILWYIAQKENLKVLYSPEIKIFHKEDASTNLLLDKGIKKRKFVYNNSLKSLLLLKEIQKNNLLYLNDILADKNNQEKSFVKWL